MDTETRMMYRFLIVCAVVCLIVVPFDTVAGLSMLTAVVLMSPIPWFVEWSGERFNRD